MTPAPLHLYLDSADMSALRRCLPHPVVHGVTTNPTLMRRAGVSPLELPRLLHECLALGARQVQAQVTSADVQGIVREAQTLRAQFTLGQLVVKIPATRAGLAAGAQLIADRCQVTFTAVYAPEQALFAAQLGAAYAAPYLGRLEDSGADALALVARMQALVARCDTGTRLLVASLRSREACLAMMDIGVGAMTVSPDLFAQLIDHPQTEAAEQAFLRDAQALREMQAGSTTDGTGATDDGPA